MAGCGFSTNENRVGVRGVVAYPPVQRLVLQFGPPPSCRIGLLLRHPLPLRSGGLTPDMGCSLPCSLFLFIFHDTLLWISAASRRVCFTSEGIRALAKALLFE